MKAKDISERIDVLNEIRIKDVPDVTLRKYGWKYHSPKTISHGGHELDTMDFGSTHYSHPKHGNIIVSQNGKIQHNTPDGKIKQLHVSELANHLHNFQYSNR